MTWEQPMLPFSMPDEDKADEMRWCYEAAADEDDYWAHERALREDEAYQEYADRLSDYVEYEGWDDGPDE